ncbi:hypothetical protein JMUB7547_28450 [Staphylococcus aureus]
MGLALFMKNEDIDEAITHFKEAVTIDPKPVSYTHLTLPTKLEV